MITEITFKFEDKSEYIVRPDKVGDTIIGNTAHIVMDAINKAYN